jgi:DNA processing protein
MSEDLAYWIAFHRIPGIGRVRFKLLEEKFGSLTDAWHANSAQLAAAGLDRRTLEAIAAFRPKIEPEEETERLHKHGIKALTVHDPVFPARLREIFDAPPVLYLRGQLRPEDESCVTVVGTRQITAYGRETTIRLVTDLVRNGVTIISGLARGVDAIAHQAALDAGGRTIAVQPCGLDLVYPQSHASLARKIAERGAVLSDYPLGTAPKPEYFPRRNRILAGLSPGTLVVEAPEKSGALITTAFAAEEGREVFAVPGSILSPASKGVNRLIQDGAKAVLNANDVLEELHLHALRPPAAAEARGARATAVEKPPAAKATDRAAPQGYQAYLLKHLSAEPTHVDELRRLSGLPIAEVTSALSLMELNGVARHVGAMHYVLA